MSVPPDALAKMHKMHELLKVGHTISKSFFFFFLCLALWDEQDIPRCLLDNYTGRRWEKTLKTREWFGCVQVLKVGCLSIQELEDTQLQSHQNWVYPLAIIPMYVQFLAIDEGPSKVNKFGFIFNPHIPKSKARQDITLFLFWVRSKRYGLMLLLPQTCLATQGFSPLCKLVP